MSEAPSEEKRKEGKRKVTLGKEEKKVGKVPGQK